MSSSDTSSVSQSSENTTSYAYDPQLGNQGSGALNSNSANYNLGLSGGSGNSISVLSESPTALAAATRIASDAIQAAQQSAGALADFGSEAQKNAEALAQGSTQTASAQGTKFILVLGVLAIVGVAVWLAFRKRGA